MIKTLTKHGNSLALVIEKSILDLLNLGPETPLKVTTDGTSLVVSPLKDARREKAFQKSLKRTNERYAKVFKKLAE